MFEFSGLGHINIIHWDDAVLLEFSAVDFFAYVWRTEYFTVSSLAVSFCERVHPRLYFNITF